MEFLMTYGWAILIMLVIIAILFLLGVFNPKSAVPESCTLPPGFSCYSWQIDSTGKLYLDMGQARGRTIVITALTCSMEPNPSPADISAITLENGRHGVVANGTQCRDDSGGDYTSGDSYRGKVVFTYHDLGSAVTRTVQGDISGRLEGAGGGGGGGGTPTPTPEPTASPTPSPIPTPTPTDTINSCGYIISQPGYYVVGADPPPYGDGSPYDYTCIHINSADVVLDCNHHTLTGQGGYGIHLVNANGVTVRNCHLSNFYMAISAENVQFSLIENNVLNSIQNRGIGLAGSNNNNITGNTVSGPSSEAGFGILIEGGGSSNNRIENNTVTNLNYGIAFWYSDPGNSAKDNTATGNSNGDFYCMSSPSSNDLGGNTCNTQYDCASWLCSCPTNTCP